MFDDQAEFLERFEWGEAGLRRFAVGVSIVVIVDVLSFSTAVDIAVARGAMDFPCRQQGQAAAALARRVDAQLATERAAACLEYTSALSPASLQSIPSGTRLVLPSPNGATLTRLAAEDHTPVLVGCLRNASAVAAACRGIGGPVAIIAAGEQWRHAGRVNGSLRPAVEDLAGAGAILAALTPVSPSPEARVALAAFQTAASDLRGFLRASSSGRELRERGFAHDVDLAAELDVSRTVPWLRGEALVSLVP